MGQCQGLPTRTALQHFCVPVTRPGSEVTRAPLSPLRSWHLPGQVTSPYSKPSHSELASRRARHTDSGSVTSSVTVSRLSRLPGPCTLQLPTSGRNAGSGGSNVLKNQHPPGGHARLPRSPTRSGAGVSERRDTDPTVERTSEPSTSPSFQHCHTDHQRDSVSDTSRLLSQRKPWAQSGLTCAEAHDSKPDLILHLTEFQPLPETS